MMTRQQKQSGRRAIRRTLMIAGWVAVLAAGSWLSNRVHADDDLTITPSFDTQTQLTRDQPFELKLSRALRADEGSLAIIINRTDSTSLFIVNGTTLVYSPSLVSLPLGESEMVVYLVGRDNAWRDLGSFHLHVLKEKLAPIPQSAPQIQTTLVKADVKSPQNGNGSEPPASQDGSSSTADAGQPGRFGFEKFGYVPSLTLAIKSQPAQFNFPESTRPTERATFTDGTLQFSMRNEMTRGWFGAETSFDLAGSTFQSEALRFGTLGARAPQIDLSSYLAQFKLGRMKVAVGHSSFGTSRHLISSFSSRGITMTVPITRTFDFSVAALNGTNIVGYGNFFGLGKSKHQLQTATIGVELIPKRPGGLRLEFSGVNAYIQALNSVSQGSVNDVERSKGGSVRLIATDKAGRFKLDGGFTRSQYRNPADPLLYQGTNTVAVPFLTRNARYLDVSYDVIRGWSLTRTRQVNLNLAVRHEQVDPLFKSLGASAGGDKKQNDLQLNGSIGEISFQLGHSRFNDNLRHIASILQSLTRANQFSVALPAAAIWGGTSNTSKLLPRLSYSWSRTHQFGAAVPVNGGFTTAPGSVPNQDATSQTFSAEWQFQKVNVGYTYNSSFTNNQQSGRERADFRNQTTGVRAGFNPTSKLNVSFEMTRDSANDLESSKLARTWRVGPTASWGVTKHITWTAALSNTIAGDRAETSGSRNTEFDTQFSYTLGIDRGDLKKIHTQMFIRFADRYARSRDLLIGASSLTRVQIFNAGVNVTFF